MVGTKTWLIGLLVVSSLVGAAYKYMMTSSARTSLAKTVNDHQLIQIQLADQTMQVEVVTTPDSIVQGLSGRETIGSEGMLFVFSQPRMTGFWMKEMRFDLDLIWINQGEVVAVTRQVSKPQSDQSLSDLPAYYPPLPVDMVLEVAAGQADVWGVKQGSRLRVNLDEK